MSKILIIVEGPKTEVALMNKLLGIYGISEDHELYSYNTNIYELYSRLPDDPDDYQYIDLLQILKDREHEPDRLALLNQNYSDIIMIFDFDPQDPQFSPEKIRRMTGYFVESTDMGKLYLNYPMVESFYHMKNIPDPDYDTYFTTMDVLRNKKFKFSVGQICRDGDYRKFAVDREECNTVIKQNLNKARILTDVDSETPSELQILEEELKYLKNDRISVLNTCVFYIVEYNGHLIFGADS
jgi:hypothetical protein